MLGRAPLVCALALTTTLVACGPESIPRPAPLPASSATRVEDPWRKIGTSKEWLYATADFSGNRFAECRHVLGVVLREEACNTALCAGPRDLAEEWRAKCATHAEPKALEDVRRLAEVYDRRAAERPSDCAKRFARIEREGCTNEATCRASAERWAARCGKSSGTPLTLHVLSRMVERQSASAERVTFDLRSCEELAADLRVSAACPDRFACAEAIPRVEMFRTRCEGGEGWGLTEAIQGLAVIAGANQPAPPVMVGPSATELKPGDTPVILSDGSGTIVSICGERASTMERYLEARSQCKGGSILVARAFKTPRGVEARVGSLPFPDEAAFSVRYPTILAAGELERRDATSIPAFEAELDALLARGHGVTALPEAARRLRALLSSSAPMLRRSVTAREALTRRDAALVPLLSHLARLKVASLGGRLSPLEAVAVQQRGFTRGLADVGADGTVQPGSQSRAARLDLTTMLPASMKATADILRRSKARRFDDKTLAAAAADAAANASACGASVQKMNEAKQSLVACNFVLEACELARIEGLARAADEARGAAESFFHEFDMLRSALPEDVAGELQRSAERAGCREPWW